MGYVSLSEDIVNRLHELCHMKDKSEQDFEFQAITKKPILLNNRISENVKSVEEKLKESKNIIAEFEKEKVDATNEIEKLKREVIELTRQNTEFIIRLNKKEDLLVTFRKEIKSVLEKNESYRETTENRNEEIRNNSINNLNQENAETILNFKKEVGKISSIIHRHNFHKDIGNINNLKLIVKNILGL